MWRNQNCVSEESTQSAPWQQQNFHQLSEAFKVLNDESAKADYDWVFRLKKTRGIRHQQMDAKRKKLKEDLEAREKAAASQRVNIQTQRNQFRKEVSQNLAEEQERIRQMNLQERLQQ